MHKAHKREPNSIKNSNLINKQTINNICMSHAFATRIPAQRQDFTAYFLRPNVS